MKKGDTVFISGGSNQNETGVVVQVHGSQLSVVLDGWDQIARVPMDMCFVIERNPLAPRLLSVREKSL
jgi:ribosomal protein S4E